MTTTTDRDMDHASPARTLEDAAERILRDSYAVYQVELETAKAIRSSWHAARRCFAQGENERPRVISKGRLLGFNDPSTAKSLFRAFCPSPEQPWPNEELRDTSMATSELLHTILGECFSKIKEKLQSTSASTCNASEAMTSDSKKSKRKISRNARSPSRKRQRVDMKEQYQQHCCPLDYFLYHGGKNEVPNCTPHVDRGVLIAVCLTRVPGLEVVPRGKKYSVCPELEVQNKALHSEPDDPELFQQICIMAGDSLSSILGYEDQTPPCVHYVRDDLSCARLSITYELRLE